MKPRWLVVVIPCLLSCVTAPEQTLPPSAGALTSRPMPVTPALQASVDEVMVSFAAPGLDEVSAVKWQGSIDSQLLASEAIIASAGASILARLTELGFRPSSLPTLAPVFFGRFDSVEALETARGIAGVLSIRPVLAAPILKHAPCTTLGPASDHCPPSGGDEAQLGVFNDLGYFGISQRISVYETTRATPSKFTVHSAFDGMTFVYAAPLVNPIGDSHATQVLSVVGGRYPGDEGVWSPFGASRVNVYSPNGSEHVACYAPGVERSLQYLALNRVQLVNESYECGPDAEAPAIDAELRIQDFYSRQYNLLLVKSAGNSVVSNQPACPFTANALCVGGYARPPAGGPAYSYRNPSDGREEPDVVALAVTVDTVDPLEENRWRLVGDQGTSFAAPAITGFAALLREACASHGVALSALDLRAVLRNAAAEENIAGWRYSTPKTGVDHRDGAGKPGAAKALAYCGIQVPSEAAPESHLVRGVIDFTATSAAAPTGLVSFAVTPPESRTDVSAPATVTTQPAAAVLAEVSLEVGDRLRASLSWNNCPSDLSALPPAPLTNLDLLLYNRTTGRYLYVSQSKQDVNEGFDVIIPRNEGGIYQLILNYDRDRPCATTTREPYVLAWAVWRSFSPSGGCSTNGTPGPLSPAILLAMIGFFRKRRC